MILFGGHALLSARSEVPRAYISAHPLVALLGCVHVGDTCVSFMDAHSRILDALV